MPKVLIVDDEPGICDVMRLNLESEGYDYACALGGREALEKLESERPDIVVLDIMMPEIDGWEVLSHMKADPATSDIPVILLSAKSEEISKILGFQLGAEDYVTKPFSVKELVTRIGLIMGRRTARPVVTAGTLKQERIGAYKDHALHFLDPEQIFYIAADRNYSILHTDDDSFTLHRNLSHLEKMLPEQFLRIHKSYIVNRHKVGKLTSPSRGAYQVELTDSGKTMIPVSRSKVSMLRRS